MVIFKNTYNYTIICNKCGTTLESNVSPSIGIIYTISQSRMCLPCQGQGHTKPTIEEKIENLINKYNNTEDSEDRILIRLQITLLEQKKKNIDKLVLKFRKN